VPISSNFNLRILSRCLAAVVLSLTLSLSCTAATGRYGVDLSGRPIGDLGGAQTKVVVLVFAASDCPISNRYVPEVARLTQQFSAQPVRIWWVYPNAEDTAPVVAQHNRDFSIRESAESRTLLDPEQHLVAWAHATVTPEAAVFVVDGASLREVYHGRIDDRYISLGQQRPEPQHHDLEEAITAALAGKPVSPPGGPAVGCSIVFLQK